MATVTAVITYDGTLGAPTCNVTSFTWAAAEFVDLTVAQSKAARQTLLKASKASWGSGASASPKGGYAGWAAAGAG